MPLNKYFNHTKSKAEQTLFNSLVVENLQIAGHLFYYIPRTNQTVDSILKEVRASSFSSYYEIEGYFKDVNFFAGQGDFLAKWGMIGNDMLDIIIAKSRFAELNIPGISIPRPGDLIYYGDPGYTADRPMVNAMFEITFVEDEMPFFPLGRQYVFQLKCQKFAYNQEEFDTGFDPIDALTNLTSQNEELKIGINNAIKEKETELVDFNEKNPFGNF